MKENQQTHLLSNRFYLTINKIGEKQLALPLWSHRLDWSFYFTALSRVWQCSMGWSGTHISLPTAGVAGPCYHTWLLKDAMPLKIHSRAANWEYGEDTDWSLDVSPFQMCHHFRPITGSTIKATPDWKRKRHPLHWLHWRHAERSKGQSMCFQQSVTWCVCPVSRFSGDHDSDAQMSHHNGKYTC